MLLNEILGNLLIIDTSAFPANIVGSRQLVQHQKQVECETSFAYLSALFASRHSNFATTLKILCNACGESLETKRTYPFCFVWETEARAQITKWFQLCSAIQLFIEGLETLLANKNGLMSRDSKYKLHFKCQTDKRWEMRTKTDFANNRKHNKRMSWKTTLIINGRDGSIWEEQALYSKINWFRHNFKLICSYYLRKYVLRIWNSRRFDLTGIFLLSLFLTNWTFGEYIAIFCESYIIVENFKITETIKL